MSIPEVASGEGKKSYGQILKSTTIIGGSSAINIVLGIIRTKVLAVLLGPTGVGLMGLYGSIMGTTSTLSGMGLSRSGVRQIAQAQGEGDQAQIASARVALMWSTCILGALGALTLFLLRYQVSRWSFGNSDHAGAVGWLSIGVLASVISGSQSALLNGLRRVGDLARISIIGGVLGTITSIVVVLLTGSKGIAFFMILAEGMTLLTSTYYASGVPRVAFRHVLRSVVAELRSLISLGVVFMSTSLMSVATLYLVRVIIARHGGLEESGIFQAAWSISMLYISFVLGAMGTDFYPRLSAIVKDKCACNRLVNEQTEVALLLAGPVILSMLTFSGLLIRLLYSAKFSGAASILQWQVFGDVFKVLTWPMGLILAARGMGTVFFCTELFWNVLFVAIVRLGIVHYGLSVTGAGYLACYLCYVILIHLVVTRATGFAWTPRNRHLGLILCAGCVIILLASRYNVALSYVVGGITSVAFAAYSLRSLSQLVTIPSAQRIRARLQRAVCFGRTR